MRHKKEEQKIIKQLKIAFARIMQTAFWTLWKKNYIHFSSGLGKVILRNCFRKLTEESFNERNVKLLTKWFSLLVIANKNETEWIFKKRQILFFFLLKFHETKKNIVYILMFLNLFNY